MRKFYSSSFCYKLLLAGILSLVIGSVNAQIKIGTDGANINPASLLELESANQGLLLPRMTDTIAINALNPPNGMLIYLLKSPAVGLYVRRVSGWEYLTGSLGGNGNFSSLTVSGAVTAGGFNGPLTGNVTGNATSATNFTGGLAGDVTGNQPTTVVAQVGGQSAINIASGVVRANAATAVASNNTIVARDINGDFSADQITATQGFVGNLSGNASTVTTIPNLTGEVTNTANAITLNNAAVIGKLVGGTYVPATGAVAATDNIIQAIGKVEGNANLKAPINSPTFTGTVTMPTPFVLGATSVTTTGTQMNYLNIAAGSVGTGSLVYSNTPTFTGSPNLPSGTVGFTQLPGNNSTALATTAFVTAAVGMIKIPAVPGNSTVSIPGNDETEIEYTVPGATTSATVVVSPITSLPTNVGIASSRVSATDIVRVKYRNFSPGAVLNVNPTLNITIIQ